jgi:hypothetical protein
MFTIMATATDAPPVPVCLFAGLTPRIAVTHHTAASITNASGQPEGYQPVDDIDVRSSDPGFKGTPEVRHPEWLSSTTGTKHTVFNR